MGVEKRGNEEEGFSLEEELCGFSGDCVWYGTWQAKWYNQLYRPKSRVRGFPFQTKQAMHENCERVLTLYLWLIMIIK